MAKRERITGRILDVWEENLGTRLTSDAAAGTSVLVVDDVSAFNTANDDPPGGKLQVADQVVAYTDIDDDASTITLAAPLATAVLASSDDADVWVWNDLYDQLDTVQYAEVRPEGKRDQADTIAAVVADSVDGLPNGDRGRVGEGCVLERDGDEWELVKVKGRPSRSRGLKFEADDYYVLTAADITAATATFPLSHRPIDESVKAVWRTTPQEPTEYTVNYDAQTITWPLDGFEAEGDRLWVHYAYRKGVSTPIAVELETIDLTAPNVWQVDAVIGGFTSTGTNTSVCGGETKLGQVGSISYKSNPTFAGSNTAATTTKPTLPAWVPGIRVYIVVAGDHIPRATQYDGVVCTGAGGGAGPPNLRITVAPGQTTYYPGDPNTGVIASDPGTYVSSNLAGLDPASRAYLCAPYASAFFLARLREASVTLGADAWGAFFSSGPQSIHREWSIDKLGIILVYPEV